MYMKRSKEHEHIICICVHVYILTAPFGACWVSLLISFSLINYIFLRGYYLNSKNVSRNIMKCVMYTVGFESCDYTNDFHVLLSNSYVSDLFYVPKYFL